MNAINDPRALDNCVVSLDEEGRRAVRHYWERVIWEEWVPPSRWEPRAMSVGGAARQAREARRAMARVAAAGRLAPVVALRSAAVVSVAGGSVRAGEAA